MKVKYRSSCEDLLADIGPRSVSASKCSNDGWGNGGHRHSRTRELMSAPGQTGSRVLEWRHRGKEGEGREREGNPRGTPEGKPSCEDLLVDFGEQVLT